MANGVGTSESSETMISIPIVEYESLKQQVQWFTEQLLLSKKRQFGTSSEKSDPDQMSIFNEVEVTADETVSESELHEVIKRRKSTKRGISKLPDDLPVEIVEHTLPEEKQACPACGGNLHVMGKDTRDELRIIPAKAVIVRHIRYTYACRECEKNGTEVPVIKAPSQQPVIKGSFASPGAIAHIATQKFVMGTPLYRQEQEWKRAGIDLSRQTMSNWLMRTSSDWLEPLYDNLRRQLLEREVLHADETTLQVLNEDGKPATSKSYMWVYRSGGDTETPIVLYDYQPDRRAKRPQEFLKDFKGYLHTDGYEGYHALPEDIIVVGCWAHARRKFDEALKAVPNKDHIGSGALQGKHFCDKLFSIERGLAGLPPEERYTKRQELAMPVLEVFLAWLKNQPSAKNVFYNAVRYTLGQWKHLERYLLDGRLEISNNRAERSIKPFVIGRKNWLFANTPKGARASAVLYSIIETAKENDLDPYSYLVYVFTTAPNLDMNDPKDVETLMPANAPADCRCGAKQMSMDDLGGIV